MKFIVKRTSIWQDDVQPCPESILEPTTRIDERTVDDPKKIPAGDMTEEWYATGKNHRVENGHIKRNFDDQRWFIEIKDLADLLLFQCKYGDLIIRDSYDNDYKTIEIYDGYRE